MAAVAMIAGAAMAQTGTNQAASSSSLTAAPGAKPNELLDTQVMLDVAGFSPGTIDGKAGSSMTKALRGFQQANGLTPTGKLDEKTKAALQKYSRPGSIMVKLTNDDVGGPFTYPMPKKPEDQAKLDALNYRNMLEKLAERYHTTPEAIVEMNGPEKLIGVGQELMLPNVVPASRNYDGAMDKQGALLAELNVPGDVPKGDYIMVDKSEGTLKVYQGKFESGSDGKLIAQFPVTTGSGHDPLPLGNWKVPTFSFLPPFNYKTDLGRVRHQGRAPASTRTERDGRRRLARSDQGALWHPRHARTALDRQDRKPRLFALDQLGRHATVADDEAWVPGEIRGLTA